MDKLKQFGIGFLNTLAAGSFYTIIAAGILPALAVGAIGWFYLLEPARNANAEKQKRVEALETEVARGRAVEQSEGEFKKEFTKVVELFYDSLPLLPKETELSNVLAGVSEAARRYNVTLTGLNGVREAQKTANADKLYERELPAAAVGNYDDVMRFFLDISRQTRILIVRDFTVQSAREKQPGAHPSTCAVQFSLLAFHAPPTAEFPALPPDVKPNRSIETAAVGGFGR